MEKRKKRFWSFLLSVVLVIGLLIGIPGKGKAADEAGVWTYGGATYEAATDGMITDDSGNTCSLKDLTKLISTGSGILISGGLESDNSMGNNNLVVDANAAGITINYAHTLICDSFEGKLNNSGSFKCNSFEGNVVNYGTFECKSFKGNGTTNATFKVSDSFYNTGTDTFGLVEAEPTTKIKSAGGEFKLMIGSNTTTISSPVEGVAFELMPEDTAACGIKISSPEKNADGKYYVKDSITVVPDNSDYKIKKIGASETTDYKDSIKLTEEDIEHEGLMISVAKLSGDYSHRSYNYGDCDSKLGFGNMVFDNENPTASVSFKADDESIATPSEGQVIEAKKLEVTITAKDTNLSEIIQGNGGSDPVSIAATGSPFTKTLTYTSDPDSPEKSCYYQVYDKAGNEISLGFKLSYPKDDYTATLSVDDIYYGETIDPDIKSDITWDGDVSYEYSSDNGATFSSTKPTAAGEYKVRAVLKNSKYYNNTTLDTTFNILRYTPTVSAILSMTSVKVGQTCEVIINKPSDWETTGGKESDIVKEYKATSASLDAYSTVVPEIPGSYMVRVTLPATDKYESVSAQTGSYTIEKGELNEAILTIADIEAGGTFTPSLIADEDYDGEITYKCKPATESAYSDSDIIKIGDKILEAGKYTAIAEFSESAKYLPAKSNEVTFTVAKRKIDLGVTINSVLVGETIEIKYTPTFDIPLDVSIKEEYKGADEDDSAYTTIIPLKGGEYKLRATITGSKIYEDASVEATFIIKKMTPSNYSVTVADIEYGGTVTPVVTTDSDGKDLATYEYKKKAEVESAYSSEVPTEVGDYSIRATIPETDKYTKVTCESTFSIGKIDEDTATVKVPDTVIGTDYTPVLSTASDGKASAKYEYKPADAADTAYTTEKPTAAGKYMIRVTVPETSNYKEQTCTATFTISKKKPQIAEVSIAENIMLGEEIKPEANISPYDGPDSPVFEYKLQREDDSAYTSEVPTASGKYTVRAVIAESDEWDKIITKPADFVLGEIKTPTAKVEIPDIYVGSKYEPLLTTDSDGKDKAVFEYKSADDKEAEFSKDKPTKAGKYIVRATVPETDRYHEVTCEGTFSINKIEAKDSKVKIKDTVVGNDYSPVLTTDSDGKKDAVFEYKKASEDDSKYSKTKPKSVGEYSVRATIPETDKYLKVICESTFTIDKKTPEASVKLDNQHVGVNYKPSLTTDSDGKSKAYFEYKGKDDDAYTKDKPKEAGDYVVRATIPATDKYKKATCEAEFSITYLKEANVTYKVSGTEGKNGYYTSDVYLVAPKGYVIAASSDDKYEERIKYTSDVTRVYLKRKSDGARMEEITISQEIKIDKDAPQLINSVDDKNNKVDMSSDEEIYADRILLSFNDENLESAKVNGKSIMPDDNNNVAIVLDPEGGDKYFAIIIEDIAGNRYSKNIVIKASWMKDNSIPSGSKVKLSPGNGYKLQGGSWTVSGDSTVYSGDRVFYVNSAGDYVFVQQ